MARRPPGTYKYWVWTASSYLSNEYLLSERVALRSSTKTGTWSNTTRSTLPVTVALIQDHNTMHAGKTQCCGPNWATAMSWKLAPDKKGWTYSNILVSKQQKSQLTFDVSSPNSSTLVSRCIFDVEAKYSIYLSNEQHLFGRKNILAWMTTFARSLLLIMFVIIFHTCAHEHG